MKKKSETVTSVKVNKYSLTPIDVQKIAATNPGTIHGSKEDFFKSLKKYMSETIDK